MRDDTTSKPSAQGLWEEMERDPNVFLLGEDIGVYGGAFKVTAGMLERFGESRVVDTPISESAIVGAAIGAGLMGLRPVAEMQFADFIYLRLRPDRQLRRQVPLSLGRGRADRDPRALRRRHSRRSVPLAESGGVVRPYPGTEGGGAGDGYDAKGLIKSAIRDNDPVLFFEHKALYRRIKEDLPSRRLHRADRQGGRCPRGHGPVHHHLWRHGARGPRGRRNAGRGRHRPSRVVDLRTLLPLDEDTVLASVRKTSKVIVLHEDTLTGGIGGEIAARITEKAFEYLDGPIVRITAPDTPVPYSPPLEEAFLPNAAKVAERRAGWRATDSLAAGRFDTGILSAVTNNASSRFL